MEHYDELGVSPDASTEEIRRSYLQLARRFHPDRLGALPTAERSRAAARMARINAAWSVLADDSRRAAYDATWRPADRASGATIRDAGSGFRAFDDDEDTFDPRLIDDTPTGAPTLRRGLTFVPAGLAAAGVGAVILGALVGIVPLLTVGLVLIVASGLSFLLLPLVALLNSSRADRDF